MKNSKTSQNLLGAAALFLACVAAVDAMADPDTREKQAVHRLQLQLRAEQQEKADLAEQVEALKKQLGELQSKKGALEAKLNGESKKISELADTQIADKQQFSELSEKYRLLEQQYNASSKDLKDLQETALEKEQEKKRLDGDLRSCEKKNSELYQLSVSLMDKYRTKGVLDAMLQKEPFTQIEKVKIDNLLQDFRDKADAGRISKPNNDPRDLQHP
jgi:chromosome segregation ATPase